MYSKDPKAYGFEYGKDEWLLAAYEPFLATLVGKGIKLLELGVYKGASLRFWHDYLENAVVVGLDAHPIQINDPTGMIHVYRGYQQDITLLDRIVEEQAPDGFDVIIDDCSHMGRFARISFWHLFENHLKPGGLYAIEDWGMSFDRAWPDYVPYKAKSRLEYPRNQRLVDSLSGQWAIPIFPHLPRVSTMLSKSKMVTKMVRRLFPPPTIIPSHMHGMVGFAKELLDACALGERAIPQSGKGRYLEYGISNIFIHPWVIIVLKSTEKWTAPLGVGCQ